MGVGSTNVLERLAASIGGLAGVTPNFQPALDVPHAGVLFALPALLANGLLEGIEQHFELPKGYYGLQSIFLLLALMALARIKTIEDLRYCAPGEWGKLLGLDRIPEVRTLREKVKCLSADGQPEKWSAALCDKWMQADTTAANVLYIDGHVRVYHGEQTSLPRHYVSREKLCLRATVDYWVNAMNGEPFFYINKAVDPGLLSVLENEIVPRLEKEVPGQPSRLELEASPRLQRFTLIFDREGYSPDFMKRMKEKRIACITYHKHPKDVWMSEEFEAYPLQSIAGNVVETRLAERGVLLAGKFWVREIRKLSENGHQTSILSTDYHADLKIVAVRMAERWSQENFFRYMRQHYNLDRLIDYSLDNIPDTTRVVNPTYRQLDGEVRRLAAQYSRRLVEFGTIHLDGTIEPELVEDYQSKKAALQEEVKQLENALKEKKEKRKGTDKHISISQLPEAERFSRLATSSKHLIDTIKMIAYRAETAMVNIIREAMSRTDDGRTLLRALYQMEADLLPDEKNKTLTIQLHHLANHCSDKTIQHLCDELNETDTVFPGTELRLIYKLGTLQNP
jgi:prepilin-type processing-associated H-X9-DG protein